VLLAELWYSDNVRAQLGTGGKMKPLLGFLGIAALLAAMAAAGTIGQQIAGNDFPKSGIEQEMSSAAAKAQSGLPNRLDAQTTLVAVDAKRNVMRYKYVFDGEWITSKALDDTLVPKVCANDWFLKGMAAGGVFRFAYFRANGDVLAEIEINSDICARWPNLSMFDTIPMAEPAF